MGDHPLLCHPDVREVCVPVATLWTSPEAPRAVDRPAVAPWPDLEAWTGAMDAAVRHDLNERTVTQLVMGEGVLVLEERGDWVRVAALMQPSSAHEVGYPGWLRREHVGDPVPWNTEPTAFVMTRTAPCDLGDGSSADLSFGTALRVEALNEDTAAVLLPGGRRGEVPLDRLRLASKGQQPAYGADDVLDAAAQFIGLRYLWGGTSAWGMDCSGLVHLVFRAFGVSLPRDAFDQVEAVEPVPLDRVEPGDLYFFARPGQYVSHVGFASRRTGHDGMRWMLHAPETGEFLEERPMAPHRGENLVTAGRVRRPDTGRVPRRRGT